jgi:pimeloyl-ACP methyl ester carboxylesterase
MELTVHGRRAYAYTGGKPFDPALPCVVFLHGALNDHSVWNLLARWCAHHGYGALALDQPGHMRSEGPLLPDIEALADWTVAVLDAAGVAQAALVGHSMGSLIALEAAARHPQRVSRLVMVGTAYPMAVSAALLEAAERRPEAGMDMVNAFSLSTWAAKPSYPGPGMWLHGGGRQLMAQVQAHGPQGANVFRHDFGLCNAYAHGFEAADSVACPAHMVLGQADQMTPPKLTRELAQRLKASVHPVPGGHSIMTEQPDALLAALRRALG